MHVDKQTTWRTHLRCVVGSLAQQEPIEDEAGRKKKKISVAVNSYFHMLQCF